MIEELHLKNLADIDEIGKAFAAEAKYPGGWSYYAFQRMWSTMLPAGIGKIFVAREDGKMVGALGAAFLPDPYSCQSTAVEQFWYVLPSHRKTAAGINLYQAFKVEARKRQVKKMVMVHLASLTPTSLQRFYETEGFRLAEQTFWKEL